MAVATYIVCGNDGGAPWLVMWRWPTGQFVHGAFLYLGMTTKTGTWRARVVVLMIWNGSHLLSRWYCGTWDDPYESGSFVHGALRARAPYSGSGRRAPWSIFLVHGDGGYIDLLYTELFLVDGALYVQRARHIYCFYLYLLSFVHCCILFLFLFHFSFCWPSCPAIRTWRDLAAVAVQRRRRASSAKWRVVTSYIVVLWWYGREGSPDWRRHAAPLPMPACAWPLRPHLQSLLYCGHCDIKCCFVIVMTLLLFFVVLCCRHFYLYSLCTSFKCCGRSCDTAQQHHCGSYCLHWHGCIAMAAAAAVHGAYIVWEIFLLPRPAAIAFIQARIVVLSLTLLSSLYCIIIYQLTTRSHYLLTSIVWYYVCIVLCDNVEACVTYCLVLYVCITKLFNIDIRREKEKLLKHDIVPCDIVSFVRLSFCIK